MVRSAILLVTTSGLGIHLSFIGSDRIYIHIHVTFSERLCRRILYPPKKNQWGRVALETACVDPEETASFGEAQVRWRRLVLHCSRCQIVHLTVNEIPGVSTGRARQSRSDPRVNPRHTLTKGRRWFMRTGFWKLGSTRSHQIRVESSGGFPGSRCRMSETETLDWGAAFNMEIK